MSKIGRISLILAGLSLLCFAILRFLAGAWVPFLWVCLGLSAIFILIAIWHDRTFLKYFFGMKTTKQGLSMGMLISLVLVFLFAVNFLAVRKYKTFDFSTAQVNTLAPQSIQLLKTLSSDLRVLYFYQKGTEGVEENRRAFIELLKKYQDESPFVKLEFVEVNERPDLVEAYGVTKGNGVVFLEYQGRKNQIQKIDEQEMTSALVKVTRDHDKIVYFTVGHGERDLDDPKDNFGLNALKLLLEGNRYVVKTVNLTEKSQVPADAEVLLIIGPSQNFLSNEIKAIQSYLQSGGSLIMALEPKFSASLNPILTDLGLVAKNNYLVNFLETPIGRAVNPQSTTGTVFSAAEQITRSFGRNQFTVFRLPMEILKVEKTPEDFRYDALVKTSDKTMAYPDMQFKTDGKIGSYTLAQIVRGPIGKEPKSSEFQALVFGDADFLSNQLLYQNLNRDLALNSVASLSKEENLVSIAPREVGTTQMNITTVQWTIFLFGFILLLPLALLVTAFTIWYRRRYA